MKKNLLLFICVCLTRVTLSQSWCPPGAVWTHTIIPWGSITQPKSGVVKDVYVGDTVINGITCKHILGTFKGKLSQWSPTVTLNNYRQSYSYLSNQVLYTWTYDAYNNLNTFDTLVNFYAAVGDKWLKNRYFGTCNSRQAITVINTGTVMINNIVLKKIVTTYSNTVYSMSGTYTLTATDTIIERIMSRSGFMFPMHCEVDSIYDGYLYNGDFLCYEDSSFASYQRAGTNGCAYVPDGLQEQGLYQFNIRLYPNPCSGSLVLESEHFVEHGLYKVSILDAMGQYIYQKEIRALNGQVRLSTEALSVGMYYVQVSDKKGVLAAEKLIRE